MELAGDVRGRDHDGERLLVRVTLSVEPAAVRPVAVDLAFHLLGIINLRQFFHSYSSKQKRPGDNLRGAKTYAVPPDFRFTESGTRILCNGRTRPFLLFLFKTAAPGRPSAAASQGLAPTALSLRSAGSLLLPFCAFYQINIPLFVLFVKPYSMRLGVRTRPLR